MAIEIDSSIWREEKIVNRYNLSHVRWTDRMVDGQRTTTLSAESLEMFDRKTESSTDIHRCHLHAC